MVQVILLSLIRTTVVDVVVKAYRKIRQLHIFQSELELDVLSVHVASAETVAIYMSW